MTFAGIPIDTFQFLADLKANNSKVWFDANRDRYEAYYKKVSLDLIDALADDMQSLDLPLRAEARLNGSFRRVNRDVRFSQDKSPYHARIHLIFWHGDHPNRSPGMHIVVHPEGLGYGAGVWGFSPAILDGYRRRIMDNDDRADLLTAAEEAAHIECDWDTPDLKKFPKGYKSDQDWEHLLRRKSFVMRTLGSPMKPEWLSTSYCCDGIMDLTRACLPLIKWLVR